MSYVAYAAGADPDIPVRNDRIRYIGFGGPNSQPEVAGVTSLVSPLPYFGTSFLAQLGIPTFPLVTTSGGSRTTASYSTPFSQTDLSFPPPPPFFPLTT